MRWERVSDFLADVTQQIHSLRANGVRSSQAILMLESELMALRRSAGMLCTGPGRSFVFVAFFFFAFFMVTAR